VTREGQMQVQKSCLPDADIRTYMVAKLAYQRLLAKELAGEDLTDDEQELKAKDGTLRSRKVAILDNFIFPAMANLTFFFESVARHRELQEVFDNDIKELLGVRTAGGAKRSPGFMFRRLVDSMVTLDNKARIPDERDFKNYRIRLLNILQQILESEVQHNIPDDMSLGAERAIMNDMNRAAAWTSTLALRVPVERHKPVRTFDFKPV